MHFVELRLNIASERRVRQTVLLELLINERRMLKQDIYRKYIEELGSDDSSDSLFPREMIDVEVNDNASSKWFASADFVSCYWQPPLDPDSYSACGIVTPRGVVASKRVLPGYANTTAHFQSSMEPFLRATQNLKPCLDVFDLQTAAERKLFGSLENIFAICERRSL